MNTASTNQTQSTPAFGVPSSVDDSVSPEAFPPWVTPYLQALGAHCCKLQAAQFAGVPLHEVVEFRHANPAFAHEEKRRLDAQPEFLESEAMRRTMTQITFDAAGHIQGRAAGSDRLLLQMMGYYIPGWLPAPRPPRPPTNREVLGKRQEQDLKDRFRALDVKMDRFGNDVAIVQDALTLYAETNAHLAAAAERAESPTFSAPAKPAPKPSPKAPSRPLGTTIAPAYSSTPASAPSTSSTASTRYPTRPGDADPFAPGFLDRIQEQRDLIARNEAAKKDQAILELVNLAEPSRKAEWLHREYRKTIPKGSYPDQKSLSDIRAQLAHWQIQAGMSLDAALALHQQRQNPFTPKPAPILPPTPAELAIAAEQSVLETKITETTTEIARLTRAGWYPNDPIRVQQSTLLRQLENCRIPISHGVPFVDAFAQEQSTTSDWKPP